MWFVFTFFPKRLLGRFKGKKARRMFFMKQYEATQKKIWGLEFVVTGLKGGKELVRREYDKLNEELDAAKILYKNNEAKQDPDKDLREKADKLIETRTKEIEEWKKKIDLSEETITQYQDQVDGLYEQLPKLEKEVCQKRSN